MKHAPVQWLLLLTLSPPAAAQEVLHDVVGDAGGDHLGSNVAGVGDVDGDGVADFAAVRSPTTQGEVRVYSGATGQVLRSHQGNRVARLGDVDQDGHADVLVAVNLGSSGWVDVYSGQTGLNLYHVTVPGTYFARNIDGVGDTNGDQVPDFVVSAHSDSNSFYFAGSVYLYSGADGSLRFKKDGTAASQMLGYSGVAGVGDVNGDGFADFAGASRPSKTVRVYSGREGNLLHHFTSSSAWYGDFVAGFGDLNGDGLDDVLVGASHDDNPSGPLAGSVYIYSGANGGLMRTLWGSHPLEQFGLHGRGVGDTDGDGHGDFAVLASGHIYLSTSYVRLFSGLDASVLGTFTIENQLGGSPDSPIDGIDDLNGDGRAELIIGDSEYDAEVGNVGRVTVYSGGCSTQPERYCMTVPNSYGTGALIGHAGSLSIAEESFVLRCYFAVPDQSGLFFYGPEQAQIPFGDGVRCIGVVAYRLPSLVTNGAGYAQHALDFGAPPSAAAQILPGASWNFQFIFRDIAAGGTGWNLSVGLSLTFCP